ncbi:PQQ-dependent sugar dehydrogenase [Kushneria phosphatilytica]|uniref:PQQ-dependent sugar dehydrogenase n=1 Tax=Kushneria phosphatilytica TaxID=657387 RepID=A0A1S1NRZ2_9GAMM|nr:PQQ-dependent sugar dehydrogenase [Kushneria phosphatilytica]OHV08784.1 glucose dehydrogenase [Kushneria phosphatilytica]QEL12504.1 PQQ-dependent sugar dehydrogenase [Kushneria phosphatilytica]
MRVALFATTLSLLLAPSLAAHGAPMEAPPPNAPDQQPAFPAQTRAPAMQSTVELQVEVVADGLVHPWALAFLPQGGMLVTERPGRLRVITAEGDISEPITGVPEVDARGQGGLLDVVLDPGFADNRRLYLSYSEPREHGKNGTAVVRATLSTDGSRLTDVQPIFHQQPDWDSTKHFGSRVIPDGEGHLFITLGERSLPEPRQQAQSLESDLGKVVRINRDGSIPDDNPFVGRDEARPEIWSYGHRNIQGAALRPGSGALWTIEHGPQGGDELNRPEAGHNYGWPVITYGEDYSGAPIGEGITKHEGMEQPIYYWDPVIAPGGMTFYTGNRFAGWQGNLLIASLRPGGVVRLALEGDRVSGEERLLEDLGRVRDVAQGPDGALWVLTDQRDGRLVRITPETP